MELRKKLTNNKKNLAEDKNLKDEFKKLETYIKAK